VKYSLVVPIYNDAYLAAAFCEEIYRVMSAHLRSDEIRQEFELIFVNDGSSNDSLSTLRELAERWPFVMVIDLSRNFGQHAAIACGMHAARGEIVMRMNVDMQDPPSEIPKLIKELELGDFDLVVGRYAKRKSPLRNRLSAWLYFRLFRALTGFDTPQNTSPLRAMNRRFVSAYNQLQEKSRFPQGLDQWLGFKHLYIEITHQNRIDNRSAYNFWSRLILALDGLMYFSDRPLKLIATSGLVVATFGIFLGLYLIVEKITGTEFLPGYASVVSLVSLAFGIQLSATGVVGLYIAKIFREVQNRPLYVVRETYGSPLTTEEIERR
jgi:dolichol-phosphate mannosyltransferase